MRFSFRGAASAYAVFVAVASCALITGCSGRWQATPALQTQAETQPKAALGLQDAVPQANPAALFAVEIGHHKVAVFDKALKEIRTLDVANAPLAVDREGDLYLSYENYQDVAIYAPPYTGSPTMVQVAPYSKWEPVGTVTVDQKTDVWAITTFETPENDAYALFYKHGSTTPCSVVDLSDGGDDAGTSVAFDAKGTLFFVNYNTGRNVGAISGECSATGIVNYPNVPGYINHIAFDSSDDLVVQTFNTKTSFPIIVYPHPKNGQLGKPIAQIQLPPIDGEPTYLQSITSDGKHMWATPEYTNSFALYDYPSGNPVKTYALPDPFYVTAYPALVP